MKLFAGIENQNNNLLAVSAVIAAFASSTVLLSAYNLRWRYAGDYLWWKPRQPKLLPMTIVEAKNNGNNEKKKIIVVFLHGMWHDASYWNEIQLYLQERGYTSYAIDLLPGERFFSGFSQKEIVADLEATLLLLSKNKDETRISSKNNNFGVEQNYIMVGHSQGGLVVQSCLLNSPSLKKQTKASALLASFPLGLVPPLKLISQKRNMYNKWGYGGICLFGKLFSRRYLSHIFLLPTTTITTDTPLNEYTDTLLHAPSDGFITMSHFPQTVGVISTRPTLILGAAEDIIYPPHFFQTDFESRFPNAVHTTILNQAHCFMDPIINNNNGESNNSNNMKDVLITWLDDITKE